MRIWVSLIILLLAGCSSVPITELTPAECRGYGVNVADNQQITGQIVLSQWGWTHTVERECGFPAGGCAKPVGEHRWEIWYAEHKCVPYHEFCHAAFETWEHTTGFLIRHFQGDRLAACPA